MSRSSPLMFVFWISMLAYPVFGADDGSTGQSVSVDQDVGLAFIINIIAYCWFSADAREEGHSPSRGLKLGVFFLNFIFVPYYLLRVKGWKRAIRSGIRFTLLFTAYIGCVFVLSLVM